jgi:hypothetical protein
MSEKLTHVSFTLGCLFVSIALLNCRALKKSDVAGDAFDSLVASKLGEKFIVKYNINRTYALCQQERTDDHQRRNLKYIVVRTKDNTLVQEGSFSMGYVQWHDEDAIEVFSSSSSRDDSGDKRIIKLTSDKL